MPYLQYRLRNLVENLTSLPDPAAREGVERMSSVHIGRALKADSSALMPAKSTRYTHIKLWAVSLQLLHTEVVKQLTHNAKHSSLSPAFQGSEGAATQPLRSLLHPIELVQVGWGCSHVLEAPKLHLGEYEGLVYLLKI